MCRHSRPLPDSLAAPMQPSLASTPRPAQRLPQRPRLAFLACLHPQQRRLHDIRFFSVSATKAKAVRSSSTPLASVLHTVLHVHPYQPAVASIRLKFIHPADWPMPQPQQHRTGQLPSRYASHLARLLDNSTVSSPYRTVLPELVDYVRRATALCCRVCKPRSSAVRLCGRTSDMPTPIEPPWSPPTSWPGALSADTPGSTQYVSVLNPWSLLFVLRRGSTPSFCLLKGCSTEVCPGMIVFIHLGTLRHQICFFPVHFKSKIPLLNPSSSLSRSINFSTASDLLIVSEEPLKPCPRRLSWPF